jgi:hypothetical protein
LNEDNIKKLLDMKSYFFNDRNVNDRNVNKDSKNYMKNMDKDINKVQDKKIDIVKKNPLFVPREKDSLFWCFYIIKNGHSSYESLYSKNDVLATQMKIEYIEKIRKEKQTVKTYKFDTLTNIESNLANDKLLNVKTLLTLCAIENINVLVVNNKTYYELLMNDNTEVHVIRCLENKNKGQYEKTYGFEICQKELVDSSIKPTLYRVDNIDKPIKAISAYKVDDLIEICNKLAIETTQIMTGKTKTKKDLYESIIQYF